MQFVEWMSKPAGRILRVVAGIILIGVGLYFQGVWGYVVAVVGVVPVLAGVFQLLPDRPGPGRALSAPQSRLKVGQVNPVRWGRLAVSGPGLAV